MRRVSLRVRLGGQEGAGVRGLPVALPVLPQPGEGRIIVQGEESRRLVLGWTAPLVKSIGVDQAAALGVVAVWLEEAAAESSSAILGFYA
jgi:hypothetical protein